MRSVILALALTGLTAGAAVNGPPAQPPATKARRDPSLERGTPEARRKLDEFGQCLVANKFRAADWLQQYALDTTTNVPQMIFSGMQDCVGGRDEDSEGFDLTATRKLMRGSIFRALYRRDHAKSPPRFPHLDADNPVAGFPDWTSGVLITSKVTPDRVASFVASRNLAACVLLEQPAIVHNMLVAPTGSPEEIALIRNLQPAVSSCITEGTTLELSLATLVGLLAEVSQRMALPQEK